MRAYIHPRFLPYALKIVPEVYRRRETPTAILIPFVGLCHFRTAVPFRGQTTQSPSSFSPKRDCSSKRVKADMFFPPDFCSPFFSHACRWILFWLLSLLTTSIPLYAVVGVCCLTTGITTRLHTYRYVVYFWAVCPLRGRRKRCSITLFLPGVQERLRWVVQIVAILQSSSRHYFHLVDDVRCNYIATSQKQQTKRDRLSSYTCCTE